MSKRFCIYGASGHAKVIIEIIEHAGMNVIYVYDDDDKKNFLFDHAIVHDPSILLLKEMEWIIAVGDNLIRKKIAENNLLRYGIVIDKSSNLTKRITIGEGTVILPGVTINSSTLIGKHVIINTNSSVDHDCIISNFVHISPNATLCGGVRIGEGTHIGAGAVVIPGITIGKWSKIGAGSIIIKDIPDNVKIVGNPGRVIENLAWEIN